MSTSDSVPQAECSVCHESFPLTAEFWYREKRKLSGFVSVCKSCFKIREQQRHEANPERRKANAHRAYLKHQDKIKARTNAYYWENHEQSLLRHQQYYEAHKDEILIKNKAWFDAHPEKSTEIKKSYIRRNPERRRQSANAYTHTDKGRAQRHNRRARVRSLPYTLTDAHIAFAVDYFHGCCACCGRQLNDLFNTHRMALDHWIPVNAEDCPGTIPTNMLPLCHGVNGCNTRKQDKRPEDFLREYFTPAQAAIIEARVQAYFAIVNEKAVLP